MTSPVDNLSLHPLFHVAGDLIATPAQGATFYIGSDEHWATRGVVEAFDAFIRAVPATESLYYTTSLLEGWERRREDDAVPAALSSLRLLLSRPRHHFFFKVANYPNAPDWGFSYTEIDARRAGRSGVIEISMPIDAPAENLLELVLRILGMGEVHCAIGGHVVRWSFARKLLAFERIFLWTQRFLGLDVQDAEAMAWFTPRALPGTSWLTYVGASVAASWPQGGFDSALGGWRYEIREHVVGDGVLIVAGDRPTLGDLNSLEFPHAYAEVARRLSPIFVQAPPAYWGPYKHDDLTRAYLRRLVEVEGWVQAHPG